MHKQTKKKLIVITAILLVISISLLITILAGKKVKMEKNLKELKYINSDEWNIIDDDFISGSKELSSAANGVLDNRQISKSVNYVVKKALPKYVRVTKNMSSKKLDKYYDKNKDKIAIDLGITERLIFKKLIKELQETKMSDEIERIRIVTDSIEKRNYSTTAELLVVYQDGERLNLRITIGYKKKTGISSIEYNA